MKLAHLLFVSGAFLVAACGDDDDGNESEAESEAEAESESESEGEPDLTCVGNNPVEPPTTKTITVSGVVVDGLTGNPVEGMLVEAFTADDDPVGLSQTTGADGAYSVTATIDGEGFTGYIRASKEMYWTSEIYALTRAITADMDLNINAVSDDTVATQGLLLDITPDENLGLVVIIVEDCSDIGLPGAVVDIDLTYEVRVYLADNGFPNTSLTETGSFGTAIFANIAVGGGTATATLDSEAYGLSALVVRPRTFSQAIVVPD
jgi:hypothetical protein